MSPGFVFPFRFISWVWSLSFRHLLLLFLFLLLLPALAFIFSVTRSFSLPEFSFFQSGTSPWHELCYSAVVLRRSAWSRSSRFGRAALCCVAWVCADARVIRFFYGRSCTPLPTPIISPSCIAEVLSFVGFLFGFRPRAEADLDTSRPDPTVCGRVCACDEKLDCIPSSHVVPAQAGC